jgi:hypothetical protein
MLKQIIEDLMFFHIQNILWIHVQGEENSTPFYFILVSFLFTTTWVNVNTCENQTLVNQTKFNCKITRLKRWPCLKTPFEMYSIIMNW